MITTPIFLVGAERSGTTLLRMMLDHHPKIAFLHEFEYAVDQFEDSSDKWPDLPTYYEYLSLHRIFLISNFAIDKSLSYPELVNSFLLQKQQRSSNKPVVGATIHYQFQYLLRIWPQAKFIHLLRDGRDVGRSVIEMGWNGNMFTAVGRWIKAELTWQQISPQIAPEHQITVKYETLVHNSDEVLSQLCDFIGVPFDKAMYDYVIHTSYSLPSPHLIEQWRRKLSNHEIQLAESRIGEMLTERGYSLSGLPLLKITPWLRTRIQLNDRWRRAVFRFRSLPPGLYLEDKIARYLFKQPGWRKQVQMKINEHARQSIRKKHKKPPLK